MQDAFFEMVDSLYADRGRVDDPHLWERAEALGLDLERFERDRRSEAVAARVRRDFESGIAAGVAGTPARFVRGRLAGTCDLVPSACTLPRQRTRVLKADWPPSGRPEVGQLNEHV